MRDPSQCVVEHASGSETVGPATRHVAEIARVLALMGDAATAMSSRLAVTRTEKVAIRSFLPLLAERHGLRATFEDEGGCVTVTFARRAL